MYYLLFIEALLITGGLSSLLLPRQDVVTVEDVVTVTVTVTRTWGHGHWTDHQDRLPPTSSEGSSMIPSGSSTRAIVFKPSVTAPSPTPTSTDTPLTPATGQPSPDDSATIFPSSSSIPIPAPGVTIFANATGLPLTPSVGPGGNPVAPSATTQAYIDNCKSPSAALPPLPTPTDDSLANWFLYYHNIHRRNHSSPDMIWSTELAADAAILFGEYASKGKSGHILGKNGDDYGQNLAGMQSWSSGSAATYGDYVVSNQQAANVSVAGWYHEGDHLTATAWAAIDAGQMSNHFTQVVSKRATLLGCAVEQKGFTSSDGYSNGFSAACNYGFNKLVYKSDVTPGLCQPQVEG